MKKIVSVCLLSAVTLSAAHAAPGYLTRNNDGSFNVTYNYTDKAKSGWYLGGRASLSLLNWTNKYSADDSAADAAFSNDEYSFEPVFGGAMFVGRKFNYFWRAEVEAGMLGQFTDKDMGIEFKMTVPYVMLNGYYDFVNGLYVGGGIGIAMPKTELDWAAFESGNRSERGVSPMFGVMLGWSHKLDENLVMDLRYRLAGFSGTEHTRVFEADGVAFTNDIGFVLDNSFSIGVRYEF